MSWTVRLRRLSNALSALLLLPGSVGLCALLAGPDNTAVVTVIPPRFSTTDIVDYSTHTHSAWLGLAVALGWLIALARREGPWGDAGRSCLLLGLAVGACMVGPLMFVLFYAGFAGGAIALLRAAMSLRGIAVAVLTCAWLLAGLIGWFMTAPPGWLVLLVMPACWPLGVALERAIPARQSARSTSR